MSDAIFLKVSVASPLRHALDYRPPENIDPATLQPGQRIRVPFRNKSVVGVLLGTSTKAAVPANKLRRAEEVLDEAPILDQSLLDLAHWAADYYHHPIGEVFASLLPKRLREGHPIEEASTKPTEKKEKPAALLLNEEQKIATDAIKKDLNAFQVFLLDGVTGSGKTEVYFQVIEAVIAEGKQALVLIPEIALTPQTVQRFQTRFSVPIAIMHSNLTDKQRFQCWCQAYRGEAKVIVGTRSAIFAALKNPGIVIVDEEHDTSFKQQDGFRYSARDLSMVRAKHWNVPVVLGSATPSLESRHNAQQGRYQHLLLSERAGNALPPTLRFIDLRRQKLQQGLSPPLIDAIEDRVKKQEQVLLFLNRRGFSPVLLCHDCGWIANCHHCDAHLVQHQRPPRMICHHCGVFYPLYRQCESCKSDQMISLGEGTERIEQVVQDLFPNVSVARIDRDSTRKKGSMAALVKAINAGEHQILIGTQMLAKGHHFPNVTLVGIINTDHGFFSADFRAHERTGQLLLQVAGRAGRAEKPGEVLIQTHHPDHPALQTLLKKGYPDFADALLEERKLAALPPSAYLALWRAEAKNSEEARSFLERLQQLAQAYSKNQLHILGPVPAPMERRAERFRWQLLLQAHDRKTLHNTLSGMLQAMDELPRPSRHLRWALDVDPQEML